jgi:hypothetical protein
MAKSFADLLLDLRAHPRDVGVMENVMDDLLTGDRGLPDTTLYDLEEFLRQVRPEGRARENPRAIAAIYNYLVGRLVGRLRPRAARPAPVIIPPPLGNAFAEFDLEGGRRRRGGYTDVFAMWQTELLETQTTAKVNDILSALQQMYNEATTALHEGDGHLSPPQQILLANYQDLVSPVQAAPSVEALYRALHALEELLHPQEHAPIARRLFGGRRKSQAKRFGSCVKSVRKTVKARKGSTAESAAIAICTTTLLHPRGRTLKRYRKGRLTTQKRLRSA